MHPYLIDTVDTSFQEQEITRIKEKLAISPFDIHILTPTPAIGIEDVRRIQHEITRKPFQGTYMLILIHHMEQATIEAQNALLKILEEPPAFAQFILTTQNRNKLLPTILSRCYLVTNTRNQEDRKKEYSEGEELFQKIITAKLGSRILLSQELAKSKEDTLAVLTQLETFLENYLHRDHALLSPLEIAKTLSKIGHARQFVERNINYKTTLDLLFLSFPKGKTPLS